MAATAQNNGNERRRRSSCFAFIYYGFIAADNALLFQAAHTLGRRIQEQQATVKIFGEMHERRAEVVSIDGYSAHADQADLLRFVTGMQRAPDAVRIVHGEDEAKDTLRRELARRLPRSSVIIPV